MNDETLAAVITGVSEATELEFDDDKLCAFRAVILEL